VSAALHIFIGEMEAKRGLLRSAESHVRLGLQILTPAPNLWLESIAENALAAIAILAFDIEPGFAHARRALRLPDKSGAVTMHRACLGNLGTLWFLIGEFDKAIDHLQRATAA